MRSTIVDPSKSTSRIACSCVGFFASNTAPPSPLDYKPAEFDNRAGQRLIDCIVVDLARLLTGDRRQLPRLLARSESAHGDIGGVAEFDYPRLTENHWNRILIESSESCARAQLESQIARFYTLAFGIGKFRQHSARCGYHNHIARFAERDFDRVLGVALGGGAPILRVKFRRD